MPLPMVHLGVAKHLAESLYVSDKSSFYLGSIAPDAVHMRNNFQPQDKGISHLRDNNNLSKDNVLEFLNYNISSEDKDFYIGYCIHILTDIYWNETVYLSFKSNYEADASPIQDSRWAYYNDTDKLDFELHKKLNYTKAMPHKGGEAKRNMVK